MTQNNLNTLLENFEKATLTDLLSRAESAETDYEENFFRTLFNLKLGEKQKEVITEDKFVM